MSCGRGDASSSIADALVSALSSCDDCSSVDSIMSIAVQPKHVVSFSSHLSSMTYRIEPALRQFPSQILFSLLVHEYVRRPVISTIRRVFFGNLDHINSSTPIDH
jgi:hypothetical protein